MKKRLLNESSITGAHAFHPYGWSPPQRAKPVEPPLLAQEWAG